MLHGTGFGGGGGGGGGSVKSWVPLPFSLPPTRYTAADTPWTCDSTQHTRDHLGQLWPISDDETQQLRFVAPSAGQSPAGPAAGTHTGDARGWQHQQRSSSQPSQRRPQQPSQPAQAPTGAGVGAGAGAGQAAAQWLWRTGAGWQPYADDVARSLETAFMLFQTQTAGAGPQGFSLVDIGGGRHVDLSAMRQVVTASPNRTRHVRRVPPGTASGGGASAAAGASPPSQQRGRDDSLTIPPPMSAASLDQTRRNFVVVLMTRESPEFGRALDVCRTSCDPSVYDICFQRDGSRHITLLTLNGITAAEAQLVTFDASNSLPLRITFSGLFQKSVLLLPDGASKASLEPLLSRDSFSLPPSGKVQTQSLIHLSLFRVRSKPHGYLQEFAKVRAACEGISWGAVEGTRVVLKETGAEYTDCRVLAGPPL